MSTFLSLQRVYFFLILSMLRNSNGLVVKSSFARRVFAFSGVVPNMKKLCSSSKIITLQEEGIYYPENNAPSSSTQTTISRTTPDHMRMVRKNTFNEKDESYMRLALRHAQHAYREKEVPIGAVLVGEDGEVIAASRNKVESSYDATAHAEIECLRRASKLAQNWRLGDCTLYTTLEPCAMCLSAIQSFRVKRVVYAAKDIRLGACGSWINLLDYQHPYHEIEVIGGVLEEESSMLLKRFFQSIRTEKFRYGSYDLGRGVVPIAEDMEELQFESTTTKKQGET